MPYFPPIASPFGVFSVNSQAAQTALQAVVGSICVRTDINTTYVLQTLPASNFAHWLAILAPESTGTVTSVGITTANGVSGTVSNPNTTPSISLTLGNITPSEVTSNQIASFNPSSVCPTLVVQAATVNAQQFFVSATGSDSTGDGSQGNPYATPYYCWQQILTNPSSPNYSPGGDATINIGPGTFALGTDTLDLTNSGIANNVNILGAGVGSTILTSTLTGNGTQVILCGTYSYVGQLTVTGSGATNQHLLAFTDGGIGINVDTVNLTNSTGSIFAGNFSPTYVNIYNLNVTANLAANIVGASISSGGGVINFYGGSFNLTSTTAGLAIIQDRSAGDGEINVFNCLMTGHGQTGSSGISQTGGQKVSTKLFGCTMLTTSVSGTPHDLSFSDNFYQFGSTGSGAGGTFTTLGGVVFQSIFTLGTIAAGSIYAPSITGGVISASQFYTQQGLFVGNLQGSVNIPVGEGLSANFTGQFLNMIQGSVELNNGTPVDNITTFTLLQLDGGNLNMVNGTGTGGSAATLWMDGATLNMGDGTGGTTYPGLNLNMDQGKLNLDSIAHLSADGSGDVQVVAAFLGLNAPIVALQNSTSTFYVSTNQSILMNGGLIKFANGTGALDLDGAGPAGNNNQLPLVNANILQAPFNQSSPAAWLNVSINGQTYFIPVYQ